MKTTKTKNVNIRVSEDEYNVIKTVADAYGKTITEMTLLLYDYANDRRPSFTVKTLKKNQGAGE